MLPAQSLPAVAVGEPEQGAEVEQPRLRLGRLERRLLVPDAHEGGALLEPFPGPQGEAGELGREDARLEVRRGQGELGADPGLEAVG